MTSDGREPTDKVIELSDFQREECAMLVCCLSCAFHWDLKLTPQEANSFQLCPRCDEEQGLVTIGYDLVEDEE